MAGKNKLTPFYANSLEVNYQFYDEGHSMDAITQNKCEAEVLAIISELASIFKADLIINTVPLGNGSFSRWFKLDAQNERVKTKIKIAIIAAVATELVVAPIGTALEAITHTAIDSVFDDPLIKEKQLPEIRKERVNLEKLSETLKVRAEKLYNNRIIKKRRSNFYEHIDKYDKVEKVSFTLQNDERKALAKDKTVTRAKISEFILVTDRLEPIEIENVNIEIIAPVLVKGRYKWIGLYNDAAIAFTMKSEGFKDLVQSGEIAFKQGFNIDCTLEVKKKIDNQGIEKLVGYEVVEVHNYFESQKKETERKVEPKEPKETKKARQKPVLEAVAIENKQTSLFDIF